MDRAEKEAFGTWNSGMAAIFGLDSWHEEILLRIISTGYALATYISTGFLLYTYPKTALVL
jgi:hypothetical protein